MMQARFASVFYLVLALVAVVGSSSAAEQPFLRTRSNFIPFDRIDFDPTSCSTTAHNMIHVSLGRSVFRWPVDAMPAFKFLREEALLLEQPLPADPTEPRGCPGNPYPLHEIGFDVEPAGPTLYPISPDLPTAFLELVFVPSGVSLQQRHEVVFAIQCNQNRWITPEGFIRCSDSADEAPLFETFKIGGETASLPSGEPLYLRCMSIPRGGTCRGNYRLDESVYLGIEVGRTAMAVAEMVNLARALVAEVEAAKVPDYPWAD